ncbi:hypothetical protein ACIOHE_11805 [Streptomyces sp. NPDC087851]|uniref:hypothetical protein n=1 Tax=Streptomyces sp. NPDC087851 TaxID=3365810 RepID=UPI0037FFAE35
MNARPSELPARAAAAVAAGRGDELPARDMLAVQSLVGNTVMSSALGNSTTGRTTGGPAARRAVGGPAVQRAGDAERERKPSGPSRGGRAGAAAGGAGRDTLGLGSDLATPAATATIAGQYDVPTFSTPDSYNVGIAGPAGTAVAAGAGLYGNVRAGRAAHQGRKQAPEGSGQHQGFSRDLSGARADGAQNTAAMVGGVLNGAGGAMNLSGSFTPAVYNGVLSGGGVAALPGAALQAGRYGRKAAKARKRVKRLEALMLAQDQQPAAALKAANEEVQARLDLMHTLDTEFEGAHAEYKARVEDQARPEGERRYPDTTNELLAGLVLTYQDLEAQLQEAVTAHATAVREAARREQAQQAISRALNEFAEAVGRHERGGDDQVTLRQIQLYAIGKNKRGVIKKMTSALAGALGVSASVASLISTIAIAAGATAGAAVLVTTPVGWGLAAAAATVALGLASYKAWKTVARRWEQTAAEAPDDGTLQHLGKTLAFWRKTGPSKREEYAVALYRFADGADPVQAEIARNTVRTLGLDWGRIKSDKESATQLIAAKMAS